MLKNTSKEGEQMKKKQYKTMKRRVCALLLTVFMTIGLCVPAMASETAADNILTDVITADGEDAAINEVAPIEEAAEPVEKQQNEEKPVTPEIEDAEKDIDESGLILTEEDTGNNSENVLTYEPTSQISTDMAIYDVMSGNALSADGIVSVNKADYEITRYKTRITVENKATQKDNAHDLYAVVLYADPEKQDKEIYIGTRITPGTVVSMYRMCDETGSDKSIDSVSDYTVLLGRGYEWVDDETKETHIEDFGLIGWTPEYDASGEPRKDSQGNIIYEEYNILDRINVPASGAKEETDEGWKDGYTGINMKAAIQKNLQIKISWAPNTKDEKQKTFKKYALYELKEDPGSVTGYSETLRWPLDNKGNPAAHSGSKSATLNPGLDTDLLVNSSLIYMLKCYDKDDKEVDKYVTAAAPYLLQMQSGFDLTLTQSRNDSSMAYILEMAARNKESDGVKITDGFKPEWRVEYGCGSLDIYSIGEYPINAKLITQAVQLHYPNGTPDIELGKAGFARIRTVAYLHGFKVISAPSNVLSCKTGPEKIFVLDSAGIRYDAKDAKNNANRENIKRIDAHLKHYFYGTDFSELSMDRNEVYIHGSNESTCAKSGMIFFHGVADESNIKSYDLYRSDKLNGTYKKLKSYPLTDDPSKSSLLLKSSEKFDGRTIYAMQYNAFPPEKEYYYTVKAVSKKPSVPGASGWGYYNLTMPDKVQEFGTADVSTLMIGLVWDRDECVKQYWIYRNLESAGNIAEKGCQGTPLAKVSPGSKEYVLYKDTKVQTDVKYYYYIRPIYDTKKAKDPMYNASLCSDEVIGKATAKYTPIKTFKVSNYATNQLMLKFNQVKGLTKYRIWRLEVDSSITTLTDDMKPDILSEKRETETYDEFEDRIEKWTLPDWENFFAKGTYKWHYIKEETGDPKKTSEKSTLDDVKVGKYYFYLIQGATDQSTGLVFTYTPRIRNTPLSVTDIKADWSGYQNGIKVSWGRNKKDDAYRSDMTVLVSLNNGKTWSVATKNDYGDYSLPRGQQRTYKVAVVYHYQQSDEVWSGISWVNCSLPTKIEVERSEYTIGVGESVSISAKAAIENGNTPTVNEIKFEKHGDCIDGSGNHYEGKKAGTGYVTLSVGGISRDVKINVVNRSYKK